MRTPLKRFYGRGDLHFVTFSCYRRRPYLGTPQARDCFVRILAEERERYGFCVFGYVVMPEHVHLLMSEPERGTPSTVLQALKQKVSRELHRDAQQNADGRSSSTGEPFWQRRFYDFNVFTAKKLFEKLEYMHENPVKRGLVERAEDWRWSSWSHYSKGQLGLIPVDSLTQEPEQEKNRTLRNQRVRHPSFTTPV